MIARINEINLSYKIADYSNTIDKVDHNILTSFINKEFICLGDKNRMKPNFIFRSPLLNERRIYSIISVIKASFYGKRGVMVCETESELKKVQVYISHLYPELKVKRIYKIQEYWNKGVPKNEFRNVDVLLCTVRDFVRLCWDFDGIVVNIGVLCFHDINILSRSYIKILAIITRFLLSKRKPILVFSSPFDLSIIKSICDCETIDYPQIRGLNSEINWSKGEKSMEEGFGYNDFELKGSKLLIIAKNRNLFRDRFVRQGNCDTSPNEEVLEFHRGYFDQDIDILHYNDPPINDQVDIILFEDIYVSNEKDIQFYVEKIYDNTGYLKPSGIVIFVPMYSEHRDSPKLSDLFIDRDEESINFNKYDQKEFLLHLLFRKMFMMDELKGVLGKFPANSNLNIELIDLDEILALLMDEQLVKEKKKKYFCSSIGKTIIRYEYLLEYLKLYYTDKKFRGGVSRTKDENKLFNMINKLAVASTMMEIKYQRYPKEVNIRSHVKKYDRSKLREKFRKYEDLYRKSPGKYKFNRYLLSQINPKFNKYDPYAPRPGARTLKIKKIEKGRDDKETKKPYGKKFYQKRKNYRNREIGKRIVFNKLLNVIKRTNKPVYWRDLIGSLHIPKTTGHRIIIDLEKEGMIKRLEGQVECNGYNREKNKLKYRGRPRKYIIPSNYVDSIPNKMCGKCCMFTKIKTCSLISKLISIGAISNIPNVEIREMIAGEVEDPRLRLHPAMVACKAFKPRKRDHEIKYLEEGIITDPKHDFRPVECYVCSSCGGALEHRSDFRTLKCPHCHTKFTKVEKDDNQEAILVNVDVKNYLDHVVKSETGVYDNKTITDNIRNAEMVKKLKRRTKIYRKKKKRKLDYFLRKIGVEEVIVDIELRENFIRKYDTPAFYQPRIRGVILSYIFATLELRSFGIVNNTLIDNCVFAQLKQLIRTL